jgi:hypothetical protein
MPQTPKPFQDFFPGAVPARRDKKLPYRMSFLLYPRPWASPCSV